MNASFSSVFDALGSGLPVLLSQFAVVIVLFVIGMALYMRLTPFDERGLIAKGNIAGGISLGGAMVALAIPLAATLATSHVLLDIIIWGIVALVLQLLAFLAATFLIRDLRRHLEAGNAAAAVALGGVQLAVAFFNAAAMAG